MTDLGSHFHSHKHIFDPNIWFRVNFFTTKAVKWLLNLSSFKIFNFHTQMLNQCNTFISNITLILYPPYD